MAAEQNKGITRITVQGYKSLVEETAIEVRPLTILAGANSSGKSSLMQPLLLLKQTLEASYDPGPLLLDGPNVRFTSAGQFLSHLPGQAAGDRFSVGVEVNGKDTFTDLFQKRTGQTIQLAETRYQWPGHEITIRPGMEKDPISRFLPKDLYRFISEDMTLKIERIRCFLIPMIMMREDQITHPFQRNFTDTFEAYLRRLIHIPGLRGNPARTYKVTAVGEEFPGTFENYVASVIHHWQETGDDRIKKLRRALETLGLGRRVYTERLNDTQIELYLAEKISIADVGFGVSQVLPVVVALLAAEPGQLVYLEQPEIHLHPRAQAALAHLLVETVERGGRLVVETHSALLLLAIQSLVAEGRLAPDLVKLYWFQQDKSGATGVYRAELDRTGAFGDWPEDFGEVELEWESRYLDAVEARQNGR